MLNQCIGPYRVIRLLGEGGMGMVYEAIRDDIGARAAVKVLRPEFARNADVATRFFNEARAANMIQHAGIVRIFDYGQLPTGEAYLAMEYLEGESLRARLERESRLSEIDAMRLARQVASALASAHSKSIVHRDLKPENIMLIADAEAPGGERVKVLDFGIAKLDAGTGGSVRTRTNTVMGTPTYMAPEQCRGIKTIDDRADVYALGIMLFEMLSGQPPFVAEAPGDIIGMHMFAPPPSLNDRLPHCDPTLNRLLAVMLVKDPAVRPSMNDVAQSLKALGNMISDVMPMRILAEQESAMPAVLVAAPHAHTARSVPAVTSQAAPPAALPEAAPRPRGEADNAKRSREAGPPPPAPSSPPIVPLSSRLSAPPLLSASRDETESTVPVRDPPTIPMRSVDLMAALAAPSPSPVDRAAPTTKRPAMSARPSRGGEDSTEVMTEGRLAALPPARGRPLPLENDETAPIMRLHDVREEQAAYLARKKDLQRSPLPPKLDAALSSLLQAGGWLVDFMQGRKTATRSDRQALETQGAEDARRKGALLFGTLVFIGLLLGLMILLAS